MTDYILEMKNITKQFPGVLALDNVDFNLKPGEVHALVGENGAGKSTLIKILAGYFQPDGGEILIEDKKVDFKTPRDSSQQGVRVIYQELNTFDDLTVAENIFIGEQKNISKSSLVDWKHLNQKARKILDRLNSDINPRKRIGKLSVSDKQIVEIARAISQEAKILVMDEPTAALSEESIQQLFEITCNLKKQGVAVIYISHRLDEIFEIADRVTVLRDGQLIDTRNTEKVEREEIIRMMVGRELKDMYPKREVPINDVIFQVENLSIPGILNNISFELKSGEILGVYGLLGSGKAELANTLFGVIPYESGDFYLKNKKVEITHPIQARENGLGLIPFDRKTEGLALEMTVKENVTMANIAGLGDNLFIDRQLEEDKVKRWINDLNIQTPDIYASVKSLSGGNQQKIVVSKWLESDVDILMLNEPTRGIDVGAKTEIYKLMEDQCEKGGAIIMVSSELPELLSISDRILVMKDGKIAKELLQAEASQEKLVNAAI